MTNAAHPSPAPTTRWQRWRRRTRRVAGVSLIFAAGWFAPWVLASCVGFRAPDDQSWRDVVLPEPTAQPIERRDLVFHEPAGFSPLKLDVFLPPELVPRPLPVVIGFFGGGFATGHRGMWHGFARDLARLGYAVVTPDYRLYSTAVWPACVDDAKAAVAWVHAHADQHGLDVSRIAAMGRSSGGYLAMMLATTAAPDSDPQKPQPMVHVAIAEASPTDLDPVLWDGSMQGGFLKGFFGDHPLDAISPAHRVTTWTAPILMFHGCTDGTVPFTQSYIMRLAMQHAGRPTRLVSLPGVGHDPLNLNWEQGKHEVYAWLQREFTAAPAAASPAAD